MNEVLNQQGSAYPTAGEVERMRAETIAALEEHGFALQWMVEFPSPPSERMYTRTAAGEVVDHRLLGAYSGTQQARLERIQATHRSYIQQFGPENVRAVTPPLALAERHGFTTVGPGLVAFMVRSSELQ